MARFIRWAANVISLDEFPDQTKTVLAKLEPGNFMVIGISVDTQLCVKRLTTTAFQLGVETETPSSLVEFPKSHTPLDLGARALTWR